MDYRKEVMRTANIKIEDYLHNLGLGGMGVAGEAGEVCDLAKKIIYHNKTVSKEKITEEMGDVYWYLEYLCIILDVSRELVMNQNIEKLKIRYPNGFNPNDANKRMDENSNDEIKGSQNK